MKVRTSEEYRQRSGECPVCGSSDISGGSVDIDGDTAWQEIGCNNCGSTWTDLYELAGYEMLELGDRVVRNGVEVEIAPEQVPA